MLLITLIVITAICIAFLAWNIKEDNFDASCGCGVVLALIVLVGWCILGCSVEVRHTETKVSAVVLHDKSVVHLSVKNEIIATYNDIATFKYLEDKTEVPIIRRDSYNMYGGNAINTTWKLPDVLQ